MSNFVRFSKNSLITNSTKDNTGSLRDNRAEETALMRLQKNLVLKHHDQKESRDHHDVRSAQQTKSIYNWLKQQGIKEATNEQSEERDPLGGSLKLKIQTGTNAAISKKSVAENISRTQTILSKIDSSKGSKNSSKVSASTKQKGKLLLDKIMSHRSKSKQKGLKKPSSGSKKSLKNSTGSPQLLGVEVGKDLLKKNASQTIRAELFEKSAATNRLPKPKLEAKNNVTKFRKFTQNLLDPNNKYLKRIGKKNNLFEMRKLTDNQLASNEGANYLSGEFHHLANSVHYEDIMSVDSHGRQPRGLYDTVGKLCHFGGTSPGKFYNLFQAKASLDQMAGSADGDSATSEDCGGVNPELDLAMNSFKDLLRAALDGNEKRIQKSLRRALSRNY